jgi:hypothetical protein
MPHALRLIIFVVVAAACAACALATPELRLRNHVIDGKATWRGNVRIDGLVTVKKTGNLVIEAGTRVVFVPRDEDGDGIGDAELLVEGSLSARGTAAAPIVLTSAAARPKPADWKYLYLDFARDAELDHIIVEYAYSGLQVHFSRARVTNSIFRYNVDGLRFSTVNLIAAGNRMHDNRHGLRYEERGSKALIQHNDIRDNDVGIFVVTRSADNVRIEQNNITDNRQYNVKLGWQQPGDVTLPHNWWGGLNREALQETFLDHKIDAALGHVRAPEPLLEPVNVTDWPQYEGAAP